MRIAANAKPSTSSLRGRPIECNQNSGDLLASQETSDRERTSLSSGLVGLGLAIALLLFHALLIFSPAGRLDWGQGWIFMGLLGASTAVGLPCVLRWNPEMIRRRARLGKGAKSWDVFIVSLLKVFWTAVHLVAGLEARGGGADSLGATWLLGLAVFALAAALTTWVLVSNPFFEQHVRIQQDNQHRVVSRGPYAIVRHPGYVGFSTYLLSVPLLLEATWAFLPAVAAAALFVFRTALEDRTLKKELPDTTSTRDGSASA